MKNKKEHILNVRLDQHTEEKLKKYSEQEGYSKSSIVKEALAMYFSKNESKQFPYILGKDLFGVASSSHKDLSSTYKSRIKKKLSEKHTH